MHELDYATESMFQPQTVAGAAGQAGSKIALGTCDRAVNVFGRRKTMLVDRAVSSPDYADQILPSHVAPRG
jgi:hypothetical protein